MGPIPRWPRSAGPSAAGWTALTAGDLVLAACSGGADSLALAAALAHEAPRQQLRAGGVTVDHGLQPGSAERARRVAAVLAGLGLDPVEAVPVTVAAGPGTGGPEAAARGARYRALDEAAGAPAPARSCSATAWTTRRKRSCSAWPAARAPGRWPGCRPAAAATGGRCSACGGPRCGRHATPLACGPGTTRTTPTPPTPGPGSGTRRSRRWRRRIGPGWRRRSPARPSQLRTDAEALDELAASQAPLLRDPDGGWLVDAARGRARRDQGPRAADGGDRGRVPPGQAHRPARRRARRPGDPLARAALGHPSGESAPCSSVAG